MPLTPEFKANVSAKLERLDADPAADGWYGRAQTELADRLNVDKSTIGKLLKSQTTSALVPRICKILEIPLPRIEPTADDAEIAEVVRMFGKLDVEGRLAFMAMLRRASGSK